MRIPANAIIHVEEMKGGVVLSVEVDGQIIYTMAYDEETDSYAELYDRNDKGRAKYMKTSWDGHFFIKKDVNMTSFFIKSIEYTKK